MLLVLLLAGVVSFLVMGLVTTGADRLLGLIACAVWSLLLVAAMICLVPRRRQELQPEPAGLVINSPTLLTASLLGAWALALVVAGVSGWLLLTDPDGMESRRVAIASLALGPASVPELIRLLQGKVHRWRIELGPDALTYRGYHADFTIGWDQIHGARVQHKPVGVRVNRTGTTADPLIPALPFRIPAQQIADEIAARSRKS